MKLLAFVDLHGSHKALRSIREKTKNEKPDLIVCAGDLTLFEKDILYFLKELNELNKPILILHGNHESAGRMEAACSNFENIVFIHKKIYKKDNYAFFGFGGEGFSVKSDELEQITKKIKKEKNLKKNKLIFITHAPPYGTKVDRINGQHGGNKSIKNFIFELKPILHICGHFHENYKTEDIFDKTKIINPGPYGKIIRI